MMLYRMNERPRMTAREIHELTKRLMQEATSGPLRFVPPIFPLVIRVHVSVWNDTPAIQRWEDEGGSCPEVDR
jgi:hypothetical protein